MTLQGRRGVPVFSVKMKASYIEFKSRPLAPACTLAWAPGVCSHRQSICSSLLVTMTSADSTLSMLESHPRSSHGKENVRRQEKIDTDQDTLTSFRDEINKRATV